MLTEEEIQRYSRHILLPQIGGKGQEKLSHASVLIVGAGGLGSPLALYLVAAGVGRIGIIDPDRVELSNLQRQILFTEEDIGHAKVKAAKKNLIQHNKNTKIEIWEHALDAQLGEDIFAGYDITCDGCDNFPTRYVVNQLCVTLRKPLISASAQRFSGQLAHFDCAKGTGCYHCLYPDTGHAPRDNCSNSGIFGSVVGTMGALQATETLKTLLHFEANCGQLLLWDAMDMNFTKLSLTRDPSCRVCGGQTTET